MSVVAVKIYPKEIHLAADSFVSMSYDTQRKDESVKIFQNEKMTVGGVGYAGDISFLRSFALTRHPSSPTEEAIVDYIVEFVEWARKKKNDYFLQSDFIIVFKGEVFFISADLYIKNVKDFYAIGAGQDYATAALYLKHSAEEAVAIACDISIRCEKPVNLFIIPKDDSNPVKS